MANILIEPTKARGVLPREDTLKSTIRSLSQDVSGIRSGLRYKIAGQEQISAKLREAVEQLQKESNSAGALRSGLEQIIQRYEQTESSNLEALVADKTAVQQGGTSPGTAPPLAEPTVDGSENNRPNFLDPKFWEDLFEDLLRQFFQNFFSPWGAIPFGLPFLAGVLDQNGPVSPFIGGLSSLFPYLNAGHTDGDVKYQSKYTGDVTKVERSQTGTQHRGYYDPKTGKTTPVDSSNEEQFKKDTKKPDFDARLAGVGASGSVSAMGTDWEENSDYAGHKGSVDFLEAEGSAEGYLGLGAFGFGMGVGFSGVTVEEKAHLGSEDNNLYTEFKGSAGKVDANVSGQFGFLDENGNFDPDAHLNLSAEALAGEVEGTIGVEIGGADVSVTGTLNFGIGGHADVGYHDGKVTFDVGASVGVGGSVKFEVDISDLLEPLKAYRAKASDVSDGWNRLFHLR